MSHSIGRNDACWCGSEKKYKKCHMDFDIKIAELSEAGHIVPSRDMIKNQYEIDRIRESCKVNIAVLDYVAERIGPGVSTEDIDKWVYQRTLELNGIPAPLNFEGYPKSVCTSINERVCHEIPSPDTILREGDIINVDVSTILNGYFSDSSRMFCIGNISEEKSRLVKTVYECVELGLAEVKPWGFLGDMAQAINDHAKSQGFSVVREIGGHGVGLEFHEDPWVSYVTKRGTEMVMAPGMIFTIEPMVNAGTDQIIQDEENGWTIYTADGKPSAQREIMVLVTENGHEVLAY